MFIEYDGKFTKENDNAYKTLAKLRGMIDEELNGIVMCEHEVEYERCRKYLINSVERYADYLKKILKF